MADYSNCKIDYHINYNGANGKKACVILNGERYMLKTPGDAKNNPLMSHSNSCISEYVSCRIANELGYDAQKTLLGTYKGNIVVLCKDFRENDKYVFYDFASLKNNIVFSSTNGANTELSEILTTIDEQKLIDPRELRSFFWDQFIIDSYIGNFDRHNGNWGYLFETSSGTCKAAPIYDCGSSLYPQLTDEQMKSVLVDERKIEERIYVFPNSAIKSEGRKINYFRFLNETENKDCIKALQKFEERFDQAVVDQVIEQMPLATDAHKEFIREMLGQRMNRILLYALENNKNIDKVYGAKKDCVINAEERNKGIRNKITELKEQVAKERTKLIEKKSERDR